MAILSLIAKLGLDKTGFDAGMAAAGKQVNTFGAGLKSQLAGAFSAAAFVAFTKNLIEAGDAIDEMSERLNISTQEAQEFSLAAKLGGADSEFFATKFEKLRAALRAGAEKGENPLAAFGIDATTDPTEALNKIAVIISTIGLNAEQAAKFTELMGRGASKMINVLGDLKTAQESGIFTSPDGIRQLKSLSDWFTIAGHNANVFGGRIIEAFKIIASPAIAGFQGKSDWSDDSGTQPPRSATVNEADIIEAQAKRIKDIEDAAKAHMATQDRILKLEEETASVVERNRVSQLSKEERLNELMLRRASLLRTVRLAVTEEGKAKANLLLAQNDADINAINNKKEKADKKFGIEESAFGRIGAFTGAAASASVSPGQAQQIQQLNKIYELMAAKGIMVKDVRR